MQSGIPAAVIDEDDFKVIAAALKGDDDGILESGKDITVFTHVQIPAEMDQEQAEAFAGGFTIGVKAQAVQTEHVGDNAFAAFQTVNMPIQ